MEEYLRRSHAFQKRLSISPLSHQEGRYLLFRMAGPLMQAKFPRMVDLEQVPVTFLHGNPHMDNYVRTFRGFAMMDFDRSRMGPYCWDIIRFLASLSLRREEEKGFLDRPVVESFIDSYLLYFMNPEIPAREFKVLKRVKPEKWQRSTNEYLSANKRWARKMRENSIGPKNPQARKILTAFLESRNEMDLLDEFKVDEAGITPGTLGKKHYIFSLLPRDPDSHHDAILFDIKEVYQEKDNKYFYSPFHHHGQRMIEASKLYGHGMESRLGFCTVDGKEYWGRKVPTFAVKAKKYLNKQEQADFAYAVGSELGKGHRKGLKNPEEADLVIRDFEKNFDKYFKISRFFTEELSLAYEAMMRKIQLDHDYRSW